jgi:methylenetetrahydrofolate reductase (NADPH)
MLESFMAGLVANGVAARTAILPSICLTKTARALTFMHENVAGIAVPAAIRERVSNASDIPEESYQLALELAQHALSLDGVAGLHITDFRHDGSFARLINDLGLDTSAPN